MISTPAHPNCSPYVIGLFNDNDLIAHYASSAPTPELSVVRETLTLIGEEALTGCVTTMAIPSDPAASKANIHKVRELQFNHSAHGDDPDESTTNYYKSRADMMTSIFDKVVVVP